MVSTAVGSSSISETIPSSTPNRFIFERTILRNASSITPAGALIPLHDLLRLASGKSFTQLLEGDREGPHPEVLNAATKYDDWDSGH